MNSGQACVAGTRILVPQARKAEIEAALAQAVAAVKSGDPRDSATDVGPMVSEKQWQRVQGYIRKGIEEGARLLAGGEGRPDGTRDGWFVRPTLFADVNNQMTVAMMRFSARCCARSLIVTRRRLSPLPMIPTTD